MSEYDNTNRIAVFKNDKQGNEKRPDYTGSLNVEGRDLDVSLWIRTSKNGVEYLSGLVSEKREKKADTLKGEPVDLKSIPF